jgi:hypothetical protein
MRVTCGIDPGRNGYICVLDPVEKTAEYLKIPYRPDGIINGHMIVDVFKDFHHVHAIYIEKVIGRGGAIKDGGANWGASQNFGLGFNYGQLLATMSFMPHTLVTPQQWQKHCHTASLRGSGITAKEKTLARFIQLNPSFVNPIKSHDGLYDSFFIARYGLVTQGIQFTDDWNFIDLG